MIGKMVHILFALAAGALLAGCAALPAVQVAGHAMTGYDAAIMVDDYLPRKAVSGGERTAPNNDRMLERRLRERLKAYCGHPVAAHVIDAKAYLVGPVNNRGEADQAIRTAATVQGLRTITCKFYHTPTRTQVNEAMVLRHELNTRLRETGWLDRVDLRVELVGTNAVFIGRTADYRQKAQALAIAAEVGGLTDVVDYISVRTPLPGERLAGK